MSAPRMVANPVVPLALAVLIAAGATAAIVAAVGGGRQGGQPVVPGVPQDVSASDAGVTLSVARAEFSGTASFLEIAVAVAPGLGEVREVRLPSEGLAPGSLRPVEDQEGIVLPVPGPLLLRLGPVAPGQEPKLETSLLDLRRPDGTWARLAGSWTLPLTLGGPANEVLRVDRMSPGPAVSDAGVEVRPVSALVSRTETLVTVEISGPAGISDLILPSIAGSSPPVYGARVATNGSLVTFAFPPLPADRPFQVDIGELIVPGTPGATGYVDFDLGAAMERQGAKGEFGEWVIIDQRDQTATSDGFRVLQVLFAKSDFDVDGADVINVHYTGNYDDPRDFTLRLPDGTLIWPFGSGTNYPLDASGNVTTGTTYTHYKVGLDHDLLRAGPLRLTYGEPSTVIRGRWVVTFEP